MQHSGSRDSMRDLIVPVVPATTTTAEPVVYGYIARSIDHFVSWQEFSASLVAHGMRVERVRTKLLGGVALHFARRA